MLAPPFLSRRQSRKLTIAFLILLGICVFGREAEAKYGGGSGEPNDPYLIYTAEQMNEIGADSNNWEKHFKLMAAIDLSSYTGTSFNLIGYNDWRGNKPFRGVFNGNDKTISNFTYNSTGRGYIGLFGYVSGENAEIKDLRLMNPDITAGSQQYVGSVVGLLDGGTITSCYVQGGSVSGTGWTTGGLVGSSSGTINNCHVENISISGGNDTGGLVGENIYGTITSCYSQANVSGISSAGGLAGYNLGIISSCYSTGSVSADEGVGGLVGYNDATITSCYAAASAWGGNGVGGLVGFSSGAIADCYAAGGVSGNDYVGGLVGYNNSYAIIGNCYSIGSVTGTTNVGGLVGHNYEGVVINSVWDVAASGQLRSDGGTARTTFDMQHPNTFMNLGWDFVGQPDGPHNIWAEPTGGGYMILWWQLSPLPALPNFAGGTGEPYDPYLISTADELNSIGHNPRLMEAHFKLTNDINLAGTNFFIIGSPWYPYAGVFDGNSKKISDFTYTSEDEAYIGLFGYVHGENSWVRDLGLINPNVDAGTAGYAIGSLVGELGWAIVSNCYAEGGSVSGGSSVGGLVGENYYGMIISSHTTGSVSGAEDVGGLVGFNDSDTEIYNCYSRSNVTGGDDVGGLVGLNYGIIAGCYYTGSVSGDNFVGGLVGYKDYTVTNCYAKAIVSGVSYIGGLLGYSSYGTTWNCYAAGTVTGNNQVGGLVGENYESEIRNSFWDTETSGQTGSEGGTGKTTAQMQTQSTFTDAGWDFVAESINGPQDIWCICEGADYPELAWQFLIADFNGDGRVGLADFAIFAERWLETDSSFFCGDGGTDLTNDGNIDLNDLKEFADNWLAKKD
ncbi:MAG: GLUG motif-containing protein [Planctomycetota bacterium]